MSQPSFIGDAASILRIHIVLIAMTAALVFGWVFTGEHPWGLAVIVGVDWLLINLLNRVTDLTEDLANGIRGTGRLVGKARRVWVIWLTVLVGSFVTSVLIWPEITPWRVGVQLVGVGYSYRVVPTQAGLRRFKDLYFFKNFMSAALFVTTCFAYPVVVAGGIAYPGGWPAFIVLIGFFVAFEITYEILYDMRDLEGDRLANVPTYPVVHGLVRSRQIVDGLLILSVVILGAGLAAGVVGLREGLMLLAPGIQLVFYRPRYARGLSSADCIWLTHVGSGLLLFWLAGTAVWLAAGGPANVFL